MRCITLCSLFKVSSDPNLQMKIQDLSTDCLGCEWTGLYKDYQVIHIDTFFNMLYFL